MYQLPRSNHILRREMKRKSKYALYWVESTDHNEDFFVQAEDELDAVQFHTAYNGYDLDSVSAIKIADLKKIRKHETYYPPEEIVKECGGELVWMSKNVKVESSSGKKFTAYPRVMRVGNRYFMMESLVNLVAEYKCSGKYTDNNILRALDLKRCNVCGFVFKLEDFPIDISKNKSSRTAMCSICRHGSKRRYNRSSKGIANTKRVAAKKQKRCETDKKYAEHRRQVVRKSCARPEYRERIRKQTRTVKGLAKKRAGGAVVRAIRQGILKRPAKCQKCKTNPGKTSSGGTKIWAYHHKGYDEKHHLDVLFLCVRCINRKIAKLR